MNKYQKHNKKIYERHKDKIKQGTYPWYSRQIPAMEGGDCFACVKCGEDVSTRVFEYYNKKHQKVKCYSCQEGGE